jgi:hypothetical protein
MANPLKGEARLREYTLAFDFSALCGVEEKTGKKVPQLLQSLSEGLGFGELRDFVYVGLQAHHPGTTEEEAVGLIETAGYKDSVAAVGKAFTGFFAPPQKEKGKGPTKPAQ